MINLSEIPFGGAFYIEGDEGSLWIKVQSVPGGNALHVNSGQVRNVGPNWELCPVVLNPKRRVMSFVDLEHASVFKSIEDDSFGEFIKTGRHEAVSFKTKQMHEFDDSTRVLKIV